MTSARPTDDAVHGDRRSDRLVEVDGRVDRAGPRAAADLFVAGPASRTTYAAGGIAQCD